MPLIPPTSIVHIDEITHSLVAFCDKPTLAILARTSSVFTEHALDALWFELDSLWNLLRLFPPGIITKEEDDFTHFTSHFVSRFVVHCFVSGLNGHINSVCQSPHPPARLDAGPIIRQARREVGFRGGRTR